MSGSIDLAIASPLTRQNRWHGVIRRFLRGDVFPLRVLRPRLIVLPTVVHLFQSAQLER
jgi:hypothetical protein